MAAIRSLIRGELPPVGNSISIVGPGGTLDFGGQHVVWLDSGTSALALALMLASKVHAARGAPEVVMPAYGCPDLVAAAAYAGIRVRLVDVCGPGPAMNLDGVRAALNENTVAVVAVNFLGISERLGELRRILDDHGEGVLLVRDDAQCFPEGSGVLIAGREVICLSFGRGKPVSLLGGGALILPAAVTSKLPLNLTSSDRFGDRFKLIAMSLTYNALRRPALYGLVSRLPFLRLGSTTFKPHTGIRGMQVSALQSLARNVTTFMRRGRERESWLRRAVHGLAGVTDVAAECGARSGRLLRFPILMPSASCRDVAFRKLRESGLGASTMYGRPLAEFAGVAPYLCATSEYPGARDFAERVLTLPVHEGVELRHVQEIRQILISCV